MPMSCKSCSMKRKGNRQSQGGQPVGIWTPNRVRNLFGVWRVVVGGWVWERAPGECKGGRGHSGLKEREGD